jgi:hypothetical protein
MSVSASSLFCEAQHEQRHALKSRALLCEKGADVWHGFHLELHYALHLQHSTQETSLLQGLSLLA